MSALAMRSLLRPLARRGRFRPASLRGGQRRLLIVQLDGVSHARLLAALQAGFMPELARRLARGQLRLSRFRSGAPASTPAFQAGLFYGRSPSVPGFIWCDRATGREVRMDRAADAAAQEARLRRGTAGLLRGGSSYFGVFSGDAAMPRFCLSGMMGERAPAVAEPPLGSWDVVASALVHGYTAARGLFRLADEAGEAVVDGLRWTAALGRLKHEPRFLVHRSFVSGVLRELAVQGILLDVSRGVPVIYADLLSFDEVAHRRGPDGPAARRQLRGMDRALGVVLSAVEAAPELGYDVYVLSDHGHVPTRPFEQLTGVPLPEFVARAERGEGLPPDLHVVRPDRGVAGGRTPGGAAGEGVATAEAGDIAHVYFLGNAGPLPLDAVRARHPRVLAALSQSPAVGMLAARGGRLGRAVVNGAVLDLAEPADVARLPHPEPSLLAAYLSDLVSLPESGDLVVLGWRGEGREVVAYAWEFGSHGGVAPEELDCFAVHPPDCTLAFERVIRPAQLNTFFESAYRAPVRDEPGRAAASGARMAVAAPEAPAP